MLVDVADDEVRSLSNWLRVSLIRRFQARPKRGLVASQLNVLRPIQVMTRITVEERAMLAAVAKKARTTASAWLREALRTAHAAMLRRRASHEEVRAR